MKDVLRLLKKDIYSVLIDYQWKFNSIENRNEIKLKIDNICDEYTEGNYSNSLLNDELGLRLETFVEIDGSVIFLESFLSR